MCFRCCWLASSALLRLWRARLACLVVAGCISASLSSGYVVFLHDLQARLAEGQERLAALKREQSQLNERISHAALMESRQQ